MPVTSRRNLLEALIFRGCRTGFGVPEIYEKVPREDEEDEFRLGNKTNDGFEGEDT